MRLLLATLLAFLSLSLVSALDDKADVIEVRRVKRQDLVSEGDADAGQSKFSSNSGMSATAQTTGSSMGTMSPSPTTDISQDPTSTGEIATGDTAIVATGTEPETVPTSSMPSSMVTVSESETTISKDPTSTAQSASGDTAIVATGAAPTATGMWAAAGLVAVGIGGLVI